MEDNLYEKRKEELLYLINTFRIIGISQYILNQENIKESFDVGLKNGSNYEDDQYYESIKADYEILAQDREVIETLEEKIYEVEYDEEDEAKCANAVYGLAAFLGMTMLKKEKNWSGIKHNIIQILDQMKLRDFITTLEIAGIGEVCEDSDIMDIIKKKIPEMSEVEFLRLHTDINEGNVELDDDLNKLITERTEKASIVLAPKYISMSDNVQDTLKILENVKNPEKIESIIEALNFWDEEIDAKINQIAESLSDEQLVRLMVAIKDFVYDNENLDELLLKRVSNFNSENFAIVILAYLNGSKEDMRNKILDIAVKKKLITSDKIKKIIKFRNTKINWENIEKRYKVYKDFSSPISDLGTMMCEDDLDNALIVYSHMDNPTEEDIEEVEDEVDRETVYKYKEFNKSVDISEQLLEYVIRLSELDEKDIVKVIKVLEEKIGDLDENNMEENPLNTIRGYAYNLLRKYLHNRILEMEDRGAILLVSTIYDNSKDSDVNNYIEAKLAECLDKIKINIQMEK